MRRFMMFAVMLTVHQSFAQMQDTFSFSYAGKTYTVTTQCPSTGCPKVYTPVSGQNWTYEPSVVLLSGGYYELIFSSGSGPTNEGIYVSLSQNPYSFPTATLLLSKAPNLYDMIDARPYYDSVNNLWHVYVQAITAPGGSNAIYEAQGPYLLPGSLLWVKTPGTNNAQEIVGPKFSGTAGLGEVLNAYNSLNYLGPNWLPQTISDNDWSYMGQDCKPNNPSGAYTCGDYCPDCAWNGTDIFVWAAANTSTSPYFWYYNRRAEYAGPDSQILGANPDVLLGGSLTAQTAGNPGLAFTTTGNPQYAYGIGFYPDLVPFISPGTYLQYYPCLEPGYCNPGTPGQGVGDTYPNPVDLIVNTAAYLVTGTGAGSASSPRVARNQFGYLDPVPGSSPLTWNSYLYYTVVTNNNLDQGFYAMQLTITQQ